MRLGTRTSALALAQAEGVAAALGPDVEIVGFVTEGDRRAEATLGSLSKGWFTDALEQALVTGQVDLAVHSLKDLPVTSCDSLVLGAVSARAPAADLLLVRPEAWQDGPGLPLRPGARLGGSSSRRAAQARALAPEVVVTPLRGNVPTRLQRLRDGAYDAILLAEAGLQRLGLIPGGLSGLRVLRLDLRVWPCAPGQGALAVQCRADDAPTRARLQLLHDPVTAAAVTTERRWLQDVGGGCAAPLGAWVVGERWVLGLDAGRGFQVRRGLGLAAGDAAAAALLAGEAGETWGGPLGEEIDVHP